jgi:hypothetical protein
MLWFWLLTALALAFDCFRSGFTGLASAFVCFGFGL